MSKRRRCIHLNSGAVFLRCALAFFAVRELVVWQWVRRFKPRGAGRMRLFLTGRWATPRSLILALLFAAAVTILLEVWIRFVVWPIVRHWHTPLTDGTDGQFHLAANERTLDSCPARLKSGWSWPAGTLVRTNLKLWFIPRAHDAEIWSRPLSEVHDIRLEPPPRIAWGYLLGWPSRLAVQDGDEAPELFAVADPEAVLAWFLPEHEPDEPEPGPGPARASPAATTTTGPAQPSTPRSS
jgi:hypothetical protein